MADLSIRSDFVEGVQEIFTTLFNGGESDGLDLYLLSENTKQNVYGENMVKLYKKPVRLVTQAHINPTQGKQDVESVKGIADFVVPLKSLQDNEIDISTTGLDKIRRGMIEFHGTFYKIDNVVPKAYIEDVFLMYTIYCTEELHVTELNVEPDEEGDENADITDEG